MFHAPPSQELLQAIRLRRQNRDLSQAHLGFIVGMPQSQLARIEKGASDVRLSTLIEIARALDLEPMLIPKQLVPAVQYMIDAPQHQSASAPRLVGNHPDDPGQDTPAPWEP